MKIHYLLPLLAMLFTTAASAQEGRIDPYFEKACMNYLNGFYQGDTTKLITALSPTLHKFGFWKNKDSGEYELASYMTYEQVKKYAKGVLEKKEFAKADAPKKVEVLDVSNNIASAKVTAYWGIDYMLLSKDGERWRIEETTHGLPLGGIGCPSQKTNQQLDQR